MSSAERRHDEAPSGTVSSVEFERALLSLGVDMTEDQLAELITDLEIETHGRVHYQGKTFSVASAFDVVYDGSQSRRVS